MDEYQFIVVLACAIILTYMMTVFVDLLISGLALLRDWWYWHRPNRRGR